MLKTCAGCGTRYAWSLSQCPHDGNVNYLESGEVVDIIDPVSTATTGTLVVEHVAQVDATSAACARTLPLAATAGVGKRLIVRKVDSSANAVTINRDGSDTIDGSTTYVLSGAGEGVELVSDGSSSWIVVQTLLPNPLLDSIFLTEAEGDNAYVPANVIIAGAGIDSTGATDSTAAIEAKLSVAASLFTKCLVYWPAGNYQVTCVRPRSGQTWDGPGARAVTITHAQENLNPYNFNMLAPTGDLTDFECRNLGFRGSLAAGQATTGTPGATGNWWYSTGDLTNVCVNDCYIRDFGDVTSTVGGGFTHVSATGKRPKNVRIERCVFENIGRIPGVYISSPTAIGYDVRVSDNRFDVTLPGTSLQHNAVFVLGWSTGGRIRDVDITGNTFVVNSGFCDDAIEVDYVDNFTIERNRITFEGGSLFNCGILVRGDCVDGTIIGNAITNRATGATAASGISILRYNSGESQRNIAIVGNAITDVRTKGVYIAAGSKNVTAIGNTVQGSTYRTDEAFYVVDGESVVISANTIGHCKHALRYDNATPGSSTIDGLAFVDNIIRDTGGGTGSEFIIGTYASGTLGAKNVRIERNTAIEAVASTGCFAVTPFGITTGNRFLDNTPGGLTELHPTHAAYAGLSKRVLTPTTVKTADYQAIVGDLVYVDCASGNVTVTLPPGAVEDAPVGVRRVDSTTNTMTVLCSGSDMITVGAGNAASITLALQDRTALLRSDGAGSWVIESGYQSLSSLDNRYLRAAEPLASGISTLPRYLGISPSATTNQRLSLTYFTPSVSFSVSSVRTISAGTAAGATPTLAKIGIYSVASNGDLTLVGSIANDTSLYASTFTAYTRALSVATAVTAGSRYALGLLIVSAAAMPTLAGLSLSSGMADELSLSPRLSGYISGQSDLPSSVSAASVGATSASFYAALIP